MTAVSVFGLGYVGSVTAACLAQAGNAVVGVEVNADKLALIRAGKSPMTERGLDGILTTVVGSGLLRVTDDAFDAVASSEVSLICVGTPSNRNGSLDLEAVLRVAEQIGAALATKPNKHTVVMRSTVLPHTGREVVVPLLEKTSGLVAGREFGYASHPEFLREGSAVSDFQSPEFSVVGELDPASGDVVAELYSSVRAPMIRVDIETAEMVKYASNAFHALKVAFANEIGHLSRSQGLDGRQVMEILCMDRRLNISSAYLRPGFAFGGSCLPKDTRALIYRARENEVEVPLLAAVLPSNEVQVQRAISAIEDIGAKQIGIFGLAFKAGTDDVRESPMVTVVETLVGRGYDVRVFDDHVRPGSMMGANRGYLESVIPHIAQLMIDDIDEVIKASDVLVVGNASARFTDLGTRMDGRQTLIDLVGIVNLDEPPVGRYLGSGW